MPAKPVFYSAPLVPNRFAPLPLGAVRPEGWLQDQLTLCANGLSGQLPRYWPELGDDNAWMGGKGSDEVHALQYLDGLVPLAFVTEDAALKEEAERRVSRLLTGQRGDGFFGPAKNPDWWPRSVAYKALMQYYSATADSAVLLFLLRAMRHQLDALDTRPLSPYAAARAGETIHVALWLYALTEKSFLLDLCQKLQTQGVDWTSILHTLSLKRPMSRHITWHAMRRGMEEENGNLQGPYTREFHQHHAVNIAMGMKTPALSHILTGGIKHREAFDVGFARLMRFHGVAYGMFTGDVLLDGTSPTQGTDLCAVTELMYTLETLLATLGNSEYGDLLDQLAFNALPAAFSPDMRSHQSVQQANQVCSERQTRRWYNKHHEANMYGFQAHKGCCTANFHQGYPKFTASLWMLTSDGGLCAMSYAPCTVRYRIGEAPVRLTVRSNYPFDGEIRIHIALREDLAFPLHLRIPAWAQGANVRLRSQERFCTPGSYSTIHRTWRNGDELHLSLPMNVDLTDWHHQSTAVQRGPLLFALQPKERWEIAQAHDFAPDYTIMPESAWNYALLLERGFSVEYDAGGVAPFKKGNAVSITAYGARLPEWEMKGSSADQPPISPEVNPSDVEEIKLVPYGDTSLRISQFPQGKEAPEI